MIKLQRNEIEIEKNRTGWRSQEDNGEKLGFAEVELEVKGVWNWDWWLGEGNSAAVFVFSNGDEILKPTVFF